VSPVPAPSNIIVRTTRARLIRRPTHKGSFEANYRFLEKADLNFTLLMVGDKDDVGGTRVPGYMVANLAGGYRINEYIRLFTRVDNLFGKKYQELYGFGTSRVAGHGGITLTY
jgi:vitamin B12 transporter